jgi:hypothetical protein
LNNVTYFPRWFAWGTTVAVVREGVGAFSVGKDGWIPVSPADVTFDGTEMSETAARRAFTDEFDMAGEPPAWRAGAA